MSLTEAFLTEAGGMRGLEAGSNRVREDHGSTGPSLYTDDFNSYANGLLHVVAPGIWLDIGSPTVTGGKLVAIADSIEHTSMWAADIGLDQSVEADITVSASGGHGDASVSTRLQSDGSCYFAVLTSESGGSIDIWKRTGNSGFALLGTSTGVGFTGRVKLTSIGDQHTAYLDGVQKVQVTDATWTTQTKVGVSTYSTGGSATLDNFTVEAIATTPVYVGYRTFTGDDWIEFAIAESSVEDFLGYSVFAMTRTSADVGGVGKTWLSAGSASTLACYWYLNHGFQQEIDASGVGGYTAGTGLTDLHTADGWCIIGNSMGPQGAIPQMHRYKVSTNTWAHENGQGALGATTMPGSGGRWRIGQNNTGDEPWFGDIAAVVVFDRVLTVPEVESMKAGLSRWLDLDPVHCWDLSQDTVYDLAGHADQTSITGTPTVSAGSPLLITAPTVYDDDFSGEGSAPGYPWTAVEGSLSIISEKLGNPGGGPNVYRYDETFAADQWAEAEVAGWVEGGTCIGPAVRVNGNDLAYLWFSNIPARVAIWKRVGGTYTAIATSSAAAPATAFKARLEVEGTTYRAYINDVMVTSGTASDSSIATGQPGVLGANGAGASLDNFRCSELPYTPCAPYVVATTVTDGGPGILTVNKPAGGQAGDYYIVWYQVGDYTSGSGAPDPVISGFTTEPGGAKGINMQHTCYLWKAHTGSEGSTFTITGTESSHWSGMICYLVRGLPPSMWTPSVAHVGARNADIVTQRVYTPSDTLMLTSYKDWNPSAPTVRPAGWTQVARFGPHTGYAYALEGGDSGKSTITPTFGTRAIASVLYSRLPITYSDDYDRPDTTQTSGGVDGDGLGAEWYWSSDWQIESNRAHRSGGSDFIVYMHDVGSPDHWVEADVYPNSHGGPGFGCLNLRDGPDNASNGYLGFWAPDGRWVIGSVIGGYVDLVSVSSGGTPTFPLHLRFTAQGNVLRLYNEDSLVVSYTGASRLTGYNYVGMNAGGEPTVNNFRCGPMPYRYPVS